MILRRIRRLALSAVACASLLPLAAPAHADVNVGAYSSTGVRSAGVSKMGCTRYPSGRDVNVTRKMYEVAWKRGVSPKVMLSLFEAGWVESWLNNLNCGDADSIGVFQMRPSMGWGTYDQLQDVTYQVNKWLDVAAPLEAKYSTSGQLAQGVERSAYPTRYDQAAATAQKYINEAALPYGTIGARWTSMGASSGSLGGPMTPEYQFLTGVRATQFSNGVVFATPARGAIALWGDNNRHWLSGGGNSTYGIPTMMPKRTLTSPTGLTGLTQGFQRGWMYWSSRTGSHVVMPAIQRTFMSYGAEAGVGLPISDSATDSRGTTTQTFEKAVLKVTAAGVSSKTKR